MLENNATDRKFDRGFWVVVMMHAVALGACSGSIVDPSTTLNSDGGKSGEPQQQSPKGGSGAAPRGQGGAPGMAAAGGMAVTVPGQPIDDGVPGHLRRLSTVEYRNTVKDLLGLADFNLGAVDAFLPDARSGLFVNNLNLGAVSAIVSNYETAAESFAVERVRYHFDVLSTCPFDKTEDLCAREFIERIGKRTFRRPLTSEEVGDFQGLYKTIKSLPGNSFQDGVRVVLSALVQSQEFLYHFETGDLKQGPRGQTPLTDYEIASRLSYMFWSSMPDDQLFAAADAGALHTTTGIKSQLERILAMPRTRLGLMKFFREWLNFESSIEVYNNPLYGAARPFLQDEVNTFIGNVLFEGDGKLSTLLTAPYSFINGPLAAVYGVTGVSGDTLVKHDLDPKQRSGLMTMPIFMANSSFADGTIRPVIRGQYVRQRWLCQEMPPPPPEANTMAPVVTAGASTRQLFTEHAATPSCAGCHRLMDPIGLVFNRYQATGAYSMIDPAMPGPDGDDDDGELFETDVDGKVKGVPALARRLAASKDVQACVAQQWFRYALARSGDDPSDEASLRNLAAAFGAAAGDLRTLFRGLVESEAFRLIRTPAEGVCQ